MISKLKKQWQRLFHEEPDVTKTKILNPLVSAIQELNIPEVSSDYIVSSPEFIGIGNPKCGTSWWYRLLIEHPEISRHLLFDEKSSTSKELHYFIHFFNKPFSEVELQTYIKMFPRKKGQISGEFTTKYMQHPGCLERIHEHFPDIKILLMVRNPIDRTISQIDHLLRNRAKIFELSEDHLAIFHKYSVLPDAQLNSLYSDGLKRVYSLFDPQNVLVLQYERCKLQPIVELSKTYRFLGVDDAFVPDSLNKKINKFEYVGEPASEEFKVFLKNFFVEDVKRLKQLYPELDLTLWPEFNNA